MIQLCTAWFASVGHLGDRLLLVWVQTFVYIYKLGQTQPDTAVGMFVVSS